MNDNKHNPLIALVGRANVGKSTLFNVLTKTRDSLVADYVGLTRDRHYGTADIFNYHCRIVDTGGLLRDEEQLIDRQVDAQVAQAIAESDIVIFILDGKDGNNEIDKQIIADLRQQKKPIITVVNKCDFGDPHVIVADFYSIGVAKLIPISAEHRRGINTLKNEISDQLAKLNFNNNKKSQANSANKQIEDHVVLAVIGRPNVGKSTLLNYLLGENRLLTSPIAGTTRDAIKIDYRDKKGNLFTLIDTAGVRRKKKIKEKIEKFSIIKALQAVDSANVVLLIFNALEGICDQDVNLLGEIVKRGRALVIAVNKCEDLSTYQLERLREELARKLRFIDYVNIFYISALSGKNTKQLFPAVQQAYNCAMCQLTTNALNQALNDAYRHHQPPLVGGYAIKMQYAHQGGKNPPHIIIHGTRTSHIKASYTKYLVGFLRKRFNLYGTPIRISYREKENPYKI